MDGQSVDSKGLSVFDLDYTLVMSNSSFHFCVYLIRQKVFPVSSLFYSCWCYLRHHLSTLTLAQLHKHIFYKLLFEFPLEKLEKHVDAFLEEYLLSSIYEPALASLRSAQHLGHYTLILSNSPNFLVEPIARALGVNECKATEYQVDAQNRFANIASILEGEGKAQCVRETAKRLGLDKNHVTAYSDSFLDLPLLLAAGTAFAVNPDKKLRAFSKRYDWNII